MFEPWPESANDRNNQDCDCDECGGSEGGLSKQRKRGRSLVLPSDGTPLQPPCPPTQSLTETGSKREVEQARAAEVGRESAVQPVAAARTCGAGDGAKWTVGEQHHLQPSMERPDLGIALQHVAHRPDATDDHRSAV